MDSKLSIVNARLVLKHEIVEGAVVEARGGVIEYAGPACGAPSGRGRVIDAGGMYVSPGFIDLHVHGGGGRDFMDGDAGAFSEIARAHARHGTTSMSPTTVACENSELMRVFAAYRDSLEDELCRAMFIGLHLEGPYFPAEERGAQDEKYLRNPDPAEYERILDSCPYIRRWSVAPELEGAFALGRELERRGILASVAHTGAFYETVAEAFKNGFSHMTHFYSRMSSVRRINGLRRCGAVEAAYLNDSVTVEIIADGVHLPLELLRLVYKIKGAGSTALVTDAMRAAGLGEGEYVLGSSDNGQRVIVDSLASWLPDRSALAGSTATCDRLLRTALAAGIPLCDAVSMMSRTPARIMGLGRKGDLLPGYDADMVVFDEDINVRAVIIGGMPVYQDGI